MAKYTPSSPTVSMTRPVSDAEKMPIRPMPTELRE